MERMALQFLGVRSFGLLVGLGAIVSILLIGWGLWQLLHRRTRYGAWSIAAGVLPAAAGLIGMGRGGQGFWLAILAVQIILAVAVFYWAVYAALGKGRLAVLVTLRVAAIIVLLLILFKPAMRFTPSNGGARSVLPVLIDRSGSMGVSDDPHTPSRYEQALQMLGAQQGRMDKRLAPAWYTFGEAVQQAGGLSGAAALKPAGEGTDGTDLALAIRTAAGEYARDRVPGILLLTDGVHNAPGKLTDALIETGVPVYAVGVGAKGTAATGRPNVELLSAETPLTAVKNNTATITVRARATGIATPPPVQLFEEDATQPVASAPLSREAGGAAWTAELKWTPRDEPSRPMASVRKLRVSLPLEAAEAIEKDNHADLHVLVTEPRIRVLYVEGSMRPEYKFLRRVLDSDANVQFMALVRVSGNRFWAQGAIGGATLDRLPTTDEDFALFDVLILGDLDSTFLGEDRLQRIRQFVNDGGGLLMTGGHNSFGPGGYGATALADVLPVSIGPRSQGQEATPFVPQLTAEGQAHPIFDGISGYFHGPGGRRPDEKLTALPELLGCVEVASVKPGAALAVHPTRQNAAGPLVVLAVGRFGAGRAAAFTADTTWKWYMPLRGLGADSPYHRFWGQAVRWLAGADTKSRQADPAALLRLDRQFLRVGGQVRALAKVQGLGGAAPHGAQVSLTATREGGRAEVLAMAPTAGAGAFELTYRPPAPGRYTVRIVARDADGKELGTDELELTVEKHSAELENVDRDDPLLRRIAERSGGAFEDLSRLPELLDTIFRRAEAMAPPAPDARQVRLYNFGLLFVLFVGLLTAEWLLRRAWQLQ